MERKEAFSIAEEILRMVVNNDSRTNNHFQESVHEYICNRLDISDESLADALNIISKENELKDELERFKGFEKVSHSDGAHNHEL